MTKQPSSVTAGLAARPASNSFMDPTPRTVDRRPGSIRYELHQDFLNDTFSIERVEVLGEFSSRSAARQWMLDHKQERDERDAR